MSKFAFVLLGIAGSIGTCMAQADPNVIKSLIETGKTQNRARAHLETLTEQIGHRLTSSSSLQRACEWAADQFKSFGCTNVNLEKWGEWPVGFDRAKDGHIGRMVAPYARDFQFTTPSWTPGTNGLQRGRAVMEPSSMEEFSKNRAAYKGAWMLMLPTGAANLPSRELRDAILAAAIKAGIKGQISGSRNELVVTGGRYSIKWEELPKEVRITIRKSDFDAVSAAIKAGEKPVLEFDLRQKFVKGPIPLYNVVAEIRGTEMPDQIVIMSGHLDSWDGPGGQGALDNGTGSCVTLEAARILCAAGIKPKRTIRFVLWSGEEQGLFGSRAYVAAHQNEMANISACLVDDGGTNYWGGFAGIESQRTMFQPILDAMNAAFPELPMKFVASEKMPRGGGSDHASFNAVGVPGFFTMETGVSDYNYVHHTQHDRLQAAINAYLVQSSTASAVSLYTLANAESMMPRQPAAPTPPPVKN